MALASLLTDPNFLYLTHLLNLSPRETWGILDYGWTLYNISGDPTYKTAGHLEAILYWKGKRGALAAALVKTGFLTVDKKGVYTIADAEKRLMDWGRKRLQRAQEARQPTSAERRRTAQNGRPTDPDPGSLPQKSNIKTFDPRSSRSTKPGSATPSHPGRGKGLENPQEGGQSLVSALTAQIGGVGPPQRRAGAPKPTQPIGTYTAKDCALWAAARDRGNNDDTARALWITRAAELSQHTGGLEYFQDLISTIENGNHPENYKGVGKVHNVGAFLNKKTAEWLTQRRVAL